MDNFGELLAAVFIGYLIMAALIGGAIVGFLFIVIPWLYNHLSIGFV